MRGLGNGMGDWALMTGVLVTTFFSGMRLSSSFFFGRMGSSMGCFTTGKLTLGPVGCGLTMGAGRFSKREEIVSWPQRANVFKWAKSRILVSRRNEAMARV